MKSEDSQAAQSGGIVRTSPRVPRRKYVINPAFQWRYTWTVFASVFVVSALMSILQFGVMYDQARSRTLHMASAGPWDNTVAIILCAAAFATVMAVVFGAWTIIITHRISGPLHVMRQHFSVLAAGGFPQVRKLRKKDEFKELHDAFAEAVGALKQSRERDVAALDQALASVKEMQAAAGPNASCEQMQRCSEELESLYDLASQSLQAAPQGAHATEHLPNASATG